MSVCHKEEKGSESFAKSSCFVKIFHESVSLVLEGKSPPVEEIEESRQMSGSFMQDL